MLSRYLYHTGYRFGIHSSICTITSYSTMTSPNRNIFCVTVPRVGKPSGRLIPLTTHKGTITQTFDVSLSLVWTNRWINTVLTQWIRNVDSWDATVMKCYQVVIPPIVRLRDSIMRSRNLIPPNGTWPVALYLYLKILELPKYIFCLIDVCILK